jgi:hypothetical protein
MAKILKQQTSLDSTGNQKILLAVVLLIAGLLVLKHNALIGLGLLIGGIYIGKNGLAFKTGAVGEEDVTDLLEYMPNDWYVFNDMVVGSSQIDNIVVGSKGVHTIETKNYQGTIYGNAEKMQWKQVFPNGSSFEFYNPVKQGNKHSLELSKFLEENGLKTWVTTLVVFPHKDVELKVWSPKTRVLYLKELAAYFMEQKDVLDKGACILIVEKLKEIIPENDSA